MAATDTDPGFDTLAFARKPRAAGVGEKQAEAHAEAVRDSRTGLATKADIAMLRADTRADLAAIRADLNTSLAAIRADLDTRLADVDTRLAAIRADFDTRLADTRAGLYRVVWIQTGVITGTIVAAAGVIVAAMKFL